MVSVVVPHYNGLDDLDACLESLVRQDYPADRFEVVVCDNNSPIDRATIAARVGARARLVFEEQRGAGPARNRAVRESRGDILAFIDSDCVAEPGWLSSGVAALARADIVGGRVTIFTRGARMTGADAFERVFAFNQQRYIEELGFTGSGNMFCRRAVFEATGPFRTGVSEDIDWSHRATALGYTLAYEPNAAVGHASRADWTTLREKWRRLTREHLLVRRQAGKGRARWIARQGAVAASIIPHSVRLLRHPELSLPQRLAAVGTLVRIRLWRAAYGVRIAWDGASKGGESRSGSR